MDILAHFVWPAFEIVNNIPANDFDLSIWFLSYFINKISNGKFGIFWNDVSDVPASHILDFLDALHYSIFWRLCNKTFAHSSFWSLFKEQQPLFIDQKSQKFLFFRLKQRPILIP